MLAKRERMTREQFDSLLSQNSLKSAYNQLGTIKYTPQGAKFAAVVSSKHEKRAVVRNRLRRRVYTLYRQASSPISGILYLSKLSYKFDYETVKKAFNDLLAKTQKSSQ